MQVSVETTGTIGRRMKVAVPAEELEKKIHHRLQRLRQTVRLPGFRPGKVPMKMVEAKYGQQVLQEVSGEVIRSSLQTALGQEGLTPAGGPMIEPKTVERGKALEYVAEFEVYPQLKKLDLTGVRLERPRCQIQEEDIDRTIESVRRQRRNWKPVERPAQEDDRLLIDFKGRIDGEPFAGGEAEAYPLVLGSGAMIPGFEDGLMGASAGETRTLDIDFPGDYRAAELAGKTARFQVTVKEVAEPELPPLDEDFVKQLGVASGDMAEFRREVRQNLERERDTRERNLLRQRVFQALLEANDIEVPRGLVKEEIRRMKQQDAAQRQAQNLPAQDIDDEIYEPIARRRTLLGLIVAEIVQERGIKADPARVRSRVEALAADYDSPEKVVEWHYEKPQRLSEIEAVVLEEQVVDQLLESAQVDETSMSFQELVAAGAARD